MRGPTPIATLARSKQPLCGAKGRQNGKPCASRAMRGAARCRMHGGSSPQARAKAADRLADLIDPDRALREAARLAYSNLADFYDAQGQLKPIAQWTPAMAAAVQAVETLDRDITPGQRGPAAQVHRIKLWDKPKNLEMLFRHLGLLIEKVQHSGDVTFGWAAAPGPLSTAVETRTKAIEAAHDR